MGRLKKIDHGTRLTFYVPQSIHQKVHEQLYSELEDRIPHGALSKLGENLFTNWLRKRGVIV